VPGPGTVRQPAWPQAYSGWNSTAQLRHSPSQPPPAPGHGAIPPAIPQAGRLLACPTRRTWRSAHSTRSIELLRRAGSCPCG